VGEVLVRWVETVDVPNVVWDGDGGVVEMGEPVEAAGLEEDATGRAVEMADELDEGVG
jgi:hypothetical protein